MRKKVAGGREESGRVKVTVPSGERVEEELDAGELEEERSVIWRTERVEAKPWVQVGVVAVALLQQEAIPQANLLAAVSTFHEGGHGQFIHDFLPGGVFLFA